MTTMLARTCFSSLSTRRSTILSTLATAPQSFAPADPRGVTMLPVRKPRFDLVRAYSAMYLSVAAFFADAFFCVSNLTRDRRTTTGARNQLPFAQGLGILPNFLSNFASFLALVSAALVTLRSALSTFSASISSLERFGLRARFTGMVWGEDMIVFVAFQ